MDKSIDAATNTTFSGTILALDKTEWQIAIEQRLDSLTTVNNELSSQVTQLQYDLAVQADVLSQLR